MTAINLSLVTSLSAIDPADWDACACLETADRGRPLDPFTTHRFLFALEQSGSVGAGTGWQPQYLVARKAGTIIAAAPLYAKTHSQGEYVFDHSWADAFERAGGDYYPKLQIAVPFTPATGRRFLTRPGHEAEGTAALIQGAVQIAADNGLSSVHATFCTEAEAIAAKSMGLLHRIGEQFHWENDGYGSFDDFLAALSSRKRKAIRKERAGAQAAAEIVTLRAGESVPKAKILSKPFHLRDLVLEVQRMFEPDSISDLN